MDTKKVLKLENGKCHCGATITADTPEQRKELLLAHMEKEHPKLHDPAEAAALHEAALDYQRLLNVLLALPTGAGTDEPGHEWTEANHKDIEERSKKLTDLLSVL